ncbi:Ig-like domain-containing protein [Gracilimonas sp.]|uniref:Ig-like domain-containing protein n=1 Tax=Gracilimonas sp. TaxID=1974203 RepID=UPI002872A602|nr:Ig-like domain-containing protein [Gracilimonas sp.]
MGTTTQSTTDGIATLDVTGDLVGSVTIEAETENTALATLNDDITFSVTTDLGTPTITTPLSQELINANEATSLTVAGTVPNGANARITITDENNNQVGPTTVTVTGGNYTGDFDVSGLDDGDLEVEVVGIDASANESGPVSVDPILDTEAPTGYTVSWDTDPINSGNQTNAGFTISNGEDDADFDWTITDGTDQITDSGTFNGTTASVTGIDVSGLAEGTLTVTVALTDEAGNEGNEVSDDVEKDTTVAPSLSNIALGEDGNDNLTFSFDSDTKLGTDPSDIDIAIDGPTTQPAYTFDRSDFTETDNGDGTFTYTLSATQAYDDGDGTYTVIINDAIDGGGNDIADGGDTDDYDFDGTPPVLAVEDQQTNDKTPTIKGTSDEIGGTVSIVINGETYTGTVQSDGSWSIEVTDELEDGEYPVTATISDDAGNTTEATAAITVDTSGPLLTVSDTEASTPTPTVSGTSDAPEGSTVTVIIEGETYTTTVQAGGTWSVQVTNELPDGEYTVNASVTDELGNTTEATGTLIIDTSGPSLTVDDGTAETSTPTVTGSSDAPEGTEVTVVINGTSYTTTVMGDGTWSVILTEPLPDGEYPVNASVTDEFGNTTEATGTLTISTVSLENITITAVPNQIIADGNSTSVITVQLYDAGGEVVEESKGVVELFTDTGTLSEVTDNNDGTYTALLTSTVSTGTATITGTLNGNDIQDTEEVEFIDPGIDRLVIVSGNGQSQQVNTSLDEPLVAAAYDADDQPIEGVNLTFSLVSFPANAQNQQLSSNTVTTGPDGTGAVEFDLGTKSGEYQIEVRAAGVDTVLFRQYGVAGPLASFVIIGGDEQEQPTLSVLEDSLSVRMRDEFQNPIVGQPVDFAIFDSPEFSRGSEFEPETAVSNQHGEARAAFRLGDVGGEYRITADAVGQGFDPLEFVVTAVEKRPNPSIIDTVNTVVFDGTLDTFMYANQSTSLNELESFTAEIWVLPDSLTEYYELFNKTGNSSDDSQFLIWGEGNKLFATIYLDDGSEITVSAGSIFEKEKVVEGVQKSVFNEADSVYKWTHLALVVNDENKTIDLYKNGFRIASDNFEGNLQQGASQLQMGRGYDGEIHEIRIWNTPVSKAGIQSRMTQILSGTENNLVFYHTFDDKGIVAEDLTTNGNHLQLGNRVVREFSVRGIPNIEMNENEEYIMAFKDVDEFGDPLATIITELPKNGKIYQVTNDGQEVGAEITSVPTMLTDEKNRALYIPERNYFGDDSLGYMLEDIFENRAEAVRDIIIYSVYRPPTAFSLIYPSIKDTIYVDIRNENQMVDFNWGPSEVYGNANTEYILTIWNEAGEEEQYSGIPDTAYSIEMNKSILNIDEDFTWRVQATDGIDTTQSISELSFSISREVPLYYQLHQNYPNPFNPVTNIEYWVPVNSKVRIEIYDVLGRQVQVLVNEDNVGRGTYQFTWDARGLASGIYFYRMVSEGVNGSQFVKMKQMMLIK